MQETKQRRFVPVSTYCKMTGLSYESVMHMCDTGQVVFITTESGQRRIDTQEHGISDQAIKDILERTEKMLAALVKQFNTTV